MSEESPGFVRGMQTRGLRDRDRGGAGINSVLDSADWVTRLRSRSLEAVVPAKSPTRSEHLCSRTFLSQWNAGFNFPGTRVLVPVQIRQVRKFKVRLKKHSC